MRVRSILFGVAAGGVVFGACDSGPTDDERTAVVVCGELRAHDNRVVDIVNESVAGIAELLEGERSEAIASGLEQVTAEVVAWQGRIGTIEMGGVDEADELRSQLAVGADRALEELTRQRGLLRSGPISDRELQGAVGEWFNSVEKAMSVSEPEIFRFDRRAFKQAFLDEPDCRNVIQQFVND